MSTHFLLSVGVGIAITGRAGRSWVRIPVRTRYFSFLQNTQTGRARPHPASCSVGTRVIFCWRSVRGVKLPTHLHLGSRLRTKGAIPLLPPYVFMAWTGINFYLCTFLKPVTRCITKHNKGCSRNSGLPIFSSLNLFTEYCSHYRVTSGRLSRLSCKGQMMESAACNRVGSTMDWQHKAGVSNIITEEANSSKYSGGRLL